MASAIDSRMGDSRIGRAWRRSTAEPLRRRAREASCGPHPRRARRGQGARVAIAELGAGVIKKPLTALRHDVGVEGKMPDSDSGAPVRRGFHARIGIAALLLAAAAAAAVAVGLGFIDSEREREMMVWQS